MGCAGSKQEWRGSKVSVIYNVLESHLGEITILTDQSSGRSVFWKSMTPKEADLFSIEMKK